MPCCFVAVVALFTPGCAWCPSAFFAWVPLLPFCSGYRFAKPEIRPNFSGSHTFFLTATAKEPDRRLPFALLPIYILPLLRCCPDVDSQRQFLHLTYAFGGIQLFRERLSDKVCTRQSRKVIWDVINTLPTFVASF